MQKILTLKQLIEKEYLIVCSLLDIDRFISFCKERSINTSKQQLEQFERLRIFFPIARIARPKVKEKIEYLNNRKEYRIIGILNDGEEWTGEIKERYAGFSFEKKYAEEWMENGFLWDPATHDYEEWKPVYDVDGRQCVESYYSMFQCYSLYNLIRITRSESHAEWWCNYNKEKLQKVAEDISEWAREVIEVCKKTGIRGETSSLVCQVLSNRFYPKTQSDRRTISVSTSIFNRDWDWHKYCHDWDSKSVLKEMSISIDELKDLQQIVSMDAQNADPLKHWYELVKFVSIEEKKQLKGNALLAQTFYSMEEMMRLFYEDISGKKLDSPSEGMRFKLESYYGKGVTKNNLKYLEFLANRYHLNPRPRLILFVEGNGEEEQLPRLSEKLFGCSFPNLGIEVRNLKGIGGFTGEEQSNRYGALEKFIDYFHDKETIVFIILDNEGQAKRISTKLLEATSKSHPKRRVTKAEYLLLWKETIEFDNFTDIEIARAMTELGKKTYIFREAEISDSRNQWRRIRKADYLSILFKEKIIRDLNKRDLLGKLFDLIIDNEKKEFSIGGEPNRSVCKVVKQIIELASLNHQPCRLASWEKNQESGYFGDIKQEK
ncbi:MAG: hypothetical protein JXI43_14495 [Tissierellales bacterium]|nr:hypothetical protein [Tissierellales bacterium]